MGFNDACVIGVKYELCTRVFCPSTPLEISKNFVFKVFVKTFTSLYIFFETTNFTKSG